MPRGPHTRTNLLDATVAVASSQGYARTTTRAIAHEAGVSEAAIYRHFPDKLSLFVAAVMHQNEHVEAWVADFPDRAGSGAVRQNLAECLDRLAELKESVLPLELAMLVDPELARGRAERMAQPPDGVPRHLAEYLRREQGLGRVRADVDPARAALVLLTMLFAAATGAGPTVEDCVDLVVDGLAPRPER